MGIIPAIFDPSKRKLIGVLVSCQSGSEQIWAPPRDTVAEQDVKTSREAIQGFASPLQIETNDSALHVGRSLGFGKLSTRQMALNCWLGRTAVVAV